LKKNSNHEGLTIQPFSYQS